MSSGCECAGQGQARRMERLALTCQVGLRRSGARPARVELKDLSTSGFRAEVFDRVFVDEKIWLTLPGLEGWQARVAWIKGDEIGCEFCQPLHPAVVNSVSQRAEGR